MRHGLDRGIIVGIILTTSMMVVIAATCYYSTRQLHEDSALVIYSREMIDEINAVENDTRRVQSNHLAYLSTGFPNWIEPYNEATQRLRKSGRLLQELAHDDPVQQKCADAIVEQIEISIQNLDEVVKVRGGPNGHDAIVAIAHERGHRGFVNELLGLLTLMRGTELSRLTQREASAQTAYQQAIFYDFATTALGLATVALFTVNLKRSRRLQDRYSEDIAERREFLSATLTSIGDGVIATDATGNVTFLNAVAEKLTGWKTEAAKGKSIEFVLPLRHEMTLEAIENPIHEAMVEQRTVAMVDYAMFVSENGLLLPLDQRAAPIRDAAGVVTGAVLVFQDISEQKKADAALAKVRAESEQRKRLYHAVLSSTPDLVYIFDSSLRLLYANEAMVSLWGTTFENVVGKTLMEISIEPWRARLHTEEMEKVRVTKQQIRGEVPFDFPDGRRMYDYIFVPVFGPDGEVEAVAGTTRDVTEHKATQERLRFLDRLNESLRMIEDPIEIRATTCRLLGEYLNADRISYSELEPDDDHFVVRYAWMKTGVSNVIGTYSLDRFGPEVASTMRSGRTLILRDVKRELEPGQGAENFLQSGIQAMVACPLMKAGRLVTMIAAHGTTPRNWTAEEIVLLQEVVERSWAHVERVRSAQALRESEERVRLATEAAGVAVWVWEPVTDRVTGEHEQLYHLLGISSADGPINSARFVAEFLHPDDVTGFTNAVKQTMEHSALFRFQGRFRRPDGDLRWIELAGRLLPTPDGPPRIIGTAADITERKRLEDALKDADRKKDDFIALLAHELRNPLAPIRNGLQIIRLSNDPAVWERSHAMMDRQLANMVRHIDDLLDVSRINRNKMELRRHRTSLSEVLNSAVETARPAIDVARHQLHIALPSESIILYADLTRLAQVFSNLLTNSAKYTPRGGQIWLAAERCGESVVVTVRDTGIGIPAKSMPYIFDMFAQVDRRVERNTGGLGIGLALVKALVEMHGGTVKVESDGEDRGSLFIVTLPIECDQTPAPVVETPPIVLPKPPAKRRVLIVDDNRDGAESLSLMMQLNGEETRIAYDGLSGITQAEEFRPELILMDLGMPNLNGLETTRRIRATEWGRQIKILALTGWGQDRDREESRVAGCDGHLVKPVDLGELKKLLDGLRAN